MMSPCHHCPDISDRRSSTLVAEQGGKKGGDRGEKAHLQMAMVGVYWQELQNSSAVSSGTRTTHCERPDHSQELKPRSTPMEQRPESEQKSLVTNVA